MSTKNVAEIEDDICSMLKQRDYSAYKKKNIFDTCKRIMDIVLSLASLIIVVPIVVIVGIFIKLEDRGSMFYKQERVGYYGKKFNIYKMRSMRADAEKYGQQMAQENDPRITRVGKFIRKTRIDELPQIINILKGDMTIVGPRPEITMHTIKYSKNIPEFVDRLIVKPGLTGYAQVEGGYDTPPAEKIKLDMHYIENRNLLLDFSIILKTVIVVFTGKGAR